MKPFLGSLEKKKIKISKTCREPGGAARITDNRWTWHHQAVPTRKKKQSFGQHLRGREHVREEGELRLQTENDWNSCTRRVDASQ